jgi:hypothetical protein
MKTSQEKTDAKQERMEAKIDVNHEKIAAKLDSDRNERMAIRVDGLPRRDRGMSGE